MYTSVSFQRVMVLVESESSGWNKIKVDLLWNNVRDTNLWFLKLSLQNMSLQCPIRALFQVRKFQFREELSS